MHQSYLADWSWGEPWWIWGGHCRGNVCTSLKLWKLWHKVWNFALIDYRVFGVIVCSQILDITLPAIDGLNNWCSLTIPIWWQNPATLPVQWRFPSMSFKSGSNANFLIMLWICTACAALVTSERQSDIFRVEMIIQMVHVQHFEHWRNCSLNKSWETIRWIFFDRSNPTFDHSFLDQKKKTSKDS